MRRRFILINMVLYIAFLSFISVGAIRSFSKDLDYSINSNHVNHLYVTAKYRVAHWFQRLASGPSGGGDGH